MYISLKNKNKLLDTLKLDTYNNLQMIYNLQSMKIIKIAVGTSVTGKFR